MTLATPPKPVDRPGHALAPLLLPDDLRLTAEQFEAVCQANPDAVLELDASGHVIHMTPTGGETGARNSTLADPVGLGRSHSRLPLKLFDSSTGFRLPDGSVLSPDASLVRLERWEALTPRRTPRLCAPLPRSGGGTGQPQRRRSRGLTALRRKMAAYQANGAQLGWLLIPEQQAVEVWPASGGGDPQRLEAATSLDAGPLFPGLQIDLLEIWQG